MPPPAPGALVPLAESLVFHVGPVLAVAIFLAGCARLAWWALDRRELVPTPERPPTNLRRGITNAVISVLLLRGAFTYDKLLWVSAMAFYASLVLSLLRHASLMGVGIPPGAGRIPSTLVGAIFIAATALLLARRIFLPHVRCITDLGDFIYVGIILGVAVTGVLTDALSAQGSLTLSMAFGALTLTLDSSPPLALVYAHAALAEAFVALIPFKLAHVVTGIFVSAAHGASVPRGEES